MNTVNLINPAKTYTKTAYGRHIKKSATWVNELIKQGKLKEVVVNGARLVMELEPAAA